MRKIFVVLMLLPFVLLIWGCPLESEYDLGSAMQSSIDKRLLGKWENKTDTTDRYLLVEQDPDPEYPEYVDVYVLTSPTQDKNDADMYYARFARINGNEYLVVEYYDEAWSDYTEHYYYYYKVVDANNIIVKDVSESYNADGVLSSAEELRTHFVNSQSKADFLVNERKYKKMP